MCSYGECTSAYEKRIEATNNMPESIVFDLESVRFFDILERLYTFFV